MRLIISILFIVFSATGLFAQIEENPENWCRNGLFPRENVEFSVAKIKAKKTEKVYFYNDFSEDCPNNIKCREKSYLIAGDEIIVSRKYKNFVCAWFQPKKGSETVGWISADKVEGINLLQDINEYVGTWTFYDNEIRIKKGAKPNTFKVSGEAFWKGLGDNIHTGEIENEGILVGEDIKIGEDDNDEFACKVTLKLVGSFLIASDNMNCGGANVSFSGVYKRKIGKR